MGVVSELSLYFGKVDGGMQTDLKTFSENQKQYSYICIQKTAFLHHGTSDEKVWRYVTSTNQNDILIMK